jgi:phosphotransferase system  glucose/maltose/N-acetylglucosamine-specific IIC component
MSPFLTGLLLVLVGLAGVFWGYRIFRIILPIYGGVAGYIIAYNWLGQTSWVLALIVGVVLAIILALTALGVYYHYRQHTPKSAATTTSTG